MTRSIAAVLLLLLAVPVFAQQPRLADAMRGATPLEDEPRPPLLGVAENKDVRRVRAYSMQPPTIPHKIDGYQVDLNYNRCLSCHARGRIEETQAIPLSVTHYMDRDGNVLGEISPRRYFCTQCHVEQVEAKPLVQNNFQDIDVVLKREATQKPAARKPEKKN